MTAIARRVLVSGRVQGVWFRESTRRRATELALRGWVRNLADGRVEALFEGEADAVEAAVQFVREGPPLARVSAVEVFSEDPGVELPDTECRANRFLVR
jgi:acylphosphatase